MSARDLIVSEFGSRGNRLDTLSNQQWENLLVNLADHRLLLEALHERTIKIESMIENHQNPNNPV